MGSQCVILAGGLGTRMRPATDAIPKALLPVNGVPFVDHQLRWLSAHGVDEAVLSIGHLGWMLRDHVGDGARFGLRARWVDEGTDLRGTAGALRLTLDEGVLAERFLVTYGDSYLPIDFAAVADAFARSGAPALMTVFRNEGRWDGSNCVLEGGNVQVPSGTRADLADLFHALSVEMRLAAFEVFTRFYEIGSPQGLADLEDYLSQTCGSPPGRVP